MTQTVRNLINNNDDESIAISSILYGETRPRLLAKITSPCDVIWKNYTHECVN